MKKLILIFLFLISSSIAHADSIVLYDNYVTANSVIWINDITTGSTVTFTTSIPCDVILAPKMVPHVGAPLILQYSAVTTFSLTSYLPYRLRLMPLESGELIVNETK